MSHPRHHYERRTRLKLVDGNNNGDIARNKLIEWAEDGHWFTIKEAAKHLKTKPYLARRYVMQLKDKGLLTGRRRVQDLPSKPPIEYIYKDNWQETLENPHPELQKHVKRLKHLAAIYRQGQFPAVDSIDQALTDIGNEIRDLDELRDLLARIYDNPDLRNKNLFVKRMS